MGVSVYQVDLDGDVLTLSWDEEDPRNTASEEPPSEIVSQSATPWSTSAVGTWELTVVCAPYPGGLTARTDVTIDISDRHVYDRAASFLIYAGAGCTGTTTTSAATELGMAEEEGESAMRIWTNVVGALYTGPCYGEYAVSVVGDDLTVTNTSCQPMPECSAIAGTGLPITLHRSGT